MPHCIVEYTDNLVTDGDIEGLLRKLADRLADSGGVFPIGGIRVRAVRLSEYVIADGKENDAFVNVTVKIGPGRSETFKAAFFPSLFEVVKTHFAALCARRYLALSLYVEEVDEGGSYKQNNLHARFKPKVAE